MLEQHALVLAVHQQQAQVEVVRSKPCGICGQTRGCGASIWGRLFGHQTVTFSVDNSLQARAGEMVIIGIQDGAVMASAWQAYGWPLLLTMLGALAGTNWLQFSSQADINAFIGAAIGLLIAFVLLRWRSRHPALHQRFQPQMLKIIGR
jgi:sigma-E factor negative regulatory protein RseC